MLTYICYGVPEFGWPSYCGIIHCLFMKLLQKLFWIHNRLTASKCRFNVRNNHFPYRLFSQQLSIYCASKQFCDPKSMTGNWRSIINNNNYSYTLKKQLSIYFLEVVFNRWRAENILAMRFWFLTNTSTDNVASSELHMVTSQFCICNHTLLHYCCLLYIVRVQKRYLLRNSIIWKYSHN